MTNISLKFRITCTIKRWSCNFQFWLLSIIYHRKIKSGDIIKCHGIGYPHWKGQMFYCSMTFPDNTIGILDGIRVDARDFRVITI